MLALRRSFLSLILILLCGQIQLTGILHAEEVKLEKCLAHNELVDALFFT